MNDERFNKLEDSIDEIKTALIGNKSLGQKGIVERVVDNEKKTAQHGKVITAVTLGWAGLVAFFVYFKSHIADYIVGRIH
jgi:DNA-binding HxlR family transcriptional regulator